MAVVQPRIMDESLVKASATVLSADSAQQANPVRYLLDQLKSKTWRSDLGWIIIAGWNTKIDVSRAGPITATATIVAGTYATGADMAAAVAAALQAADAGGGWNASYDGSTHKFTITSTDVTATVLFATGPNLATSPRADLGFDVGDRTGSTIVADRASYQSRHYIALDFGSAQAITAAILHNDNVSASGSVKVLSSATSILTALTAPSATQTLVDRGTLWSLYFGSQSHQYVVFVIEDVSNSTGYAEAGIAFLGNYRAPGGYSVNFEEEGEDLSVQTQATEGAPYGDQRPEERGWQLEWRNISTANVDSIFRDFRTDTPKGKCFFFDLDSNTPNIIYGRRISALTISTSDGQNWTIRLTFREALG